MSRKQKPENTHATPLGMSLYRTPACWRFSILFAPPGGIACGAFDELGPDRGFDEASAFAKQNLEALAERTVEIEWEPGKPDWWTGEVTALGPQR